MEPEQPTQPNQPFQSKSFQLEDPAWLQELKDHGVVVVKNVVSQEEVKKTISLFWDWLEGLGSGLDRNNSTTWINESWPGIPDMGFFTGYGGAHSRASWFLRSLPAVKTTFSKIYNTPNLISSFDTFIAWRPWWHNKSWTPYVQNLHVDQNPSAKPGFHCVQGMIPLYKVDEVGGLMVVPNSHTQEVQKQLIGRYPDCQWSHSDWLELTNKDPFIGKGVLIKCEAGDMILWDSRSVHGGVILQPSEEFKEKHSKNQLVRLSLTVTMTPKSLASERVLEMRRKAFDKKIGLTHWPHEYNEAGMNILAKNIKRENAKVEVIEMTKEIRDLIG